MLMFLLISLNNVDKDKPVLPVQKSHCDSNTLCSGCSQVGRSEQGVHEISEKPPKFKDLMSAEENKKTCCDWSRESALFLLADNQLLADQVRQAGAMTLVPILICLSGWIELPKAGFGQ